MTNLTLHPRHGFFSRDPFSLARELFHLDGDSPLERSSFRPSFEVVERAGGYTLTADLPGMNESDIEITADHNRLTITGTREAEKKTDGETFHVYERSFGTFTRTFALPDEADLQSVNAKLNNGVLSVSIEKRSESQARKISITQNA